MLGKTNPGRGFKGTVEYCLQQKKNADILYANNISCTNTDGIIREFVGLSSTNDNVSKPVWHSSLSFHNLDNITNERMTEIANRFMEKAGFNPDNNQWLVIKHNDRDHTHCHIIGNRIGFDGKTVSDYYCKSRTVQWSKEIELEYKLTQVEKIFIEKRLQLPQTTEKDQLKSIIQDTLNQNQGKSFKAFQTSLKEQGIDVVVASHKKSGQAYGISFSMNQKTYKGSDIGKKFAFKALNKVISISGLNPIMKVINVSSKLISKSIELGL